MTEGRLTETKWCPGCRSLVEAERVPVSMELDVLRCRSCGKTLGQESAGTILWF